MFEQLEQALTKANSAIGEYEALGAEARRLVATDGRSAVANINKAAEVIGEKLEKAGEKVQESAREARTEEEAKKAK